MAVRRNLTGKTVGLWRVEQRDYSKANRPYYYCTCTGCGKRASIAGQRLYRTTLVGGCLFCRRPAFAKLHPKEHGAWSNIKTRCLNPRRVEYARYSKLGMEPAWRSSFAAFFSAVGPAPSPMHTLERIDNEKGYLSDNVCWATRGEQARNTRRNVLVTYNGKTQCLAQWARELNVNYGTVATRMQQGAPFAQAVLPPIGSYENSFWGKTLRKA